MSTIIFPSPVYGPVHSRRLGLSLGINLLPGDGKICNFDCLYCEIGFNKDGFTRTKHPSREAVAEALTLNRKLWTILGTSATEDSNPLPPEVKENIGNLTVFVLKRTLEIMDDPSPEKLSALIAINRSLAQGLRGQGDEE